MNLFKRAINFKLLLLMFALSCLLRLPNLNRPLANQWEICTGISLVQLDIWQRTGADNFHYLLPVNYPGVKELHVQNWKAYKKTKDTKGDYYYLSFPSFYLLIPYFLNQLFSFPISPLSLQLLNIFFHFLSLLLILKTCQLLFPQKNLQVNSIGLIACFIYCFSPSPLWFHTNIYLNFLLVIPILLFCNYQFLKIYFSEQISVSRFVQLGGGLFLLCFTEWIGFLTAFSYFLISAYFFLKTKQRKYISLGTTTGFTAIMAMGLYLWQCAGAVGWSTTINYFFYKYDEYSGSTQSPSFLLFLTRLLLWFVRGYGPVLTIIIGLLVVIWINKHSLKRLISKKASLLFAVLIIPSLLRHLLLRDYTVHHEYSTLVDGLTISFFGGVLIAYIFENQLLSKIKRALIGMTFLILNSVSFFLQHFPGRKSFNGYPYDVARNIGTIINNYAAKDEAVFLVGYNREYEWQLIWYAKTNVGFCKDFEEMNRKMQNLNITKAKAFVLDPSYMHTGKVAYIKNIQLPQK